MNPDNANIEMELNERRLQARARFTHCRQSQHRTRDRRGLRKPRPATGRCALRQRDGYFGNRREQIAYRLLRHALPTSGGSRDARRGGMLMSYGGSRLDFISPVRQLVGRILSGRSRQPAGDAAIKFEFVINLKIAKALGLTVPSALLARADEVMNKRVIDRLALLECR